MDNLLTINDLEIEEVEDILSLANKLKAEQKKGVSHHKLAGKSLGLIFAKSSTRTRVSFEVGIQQLGGQGIFLSSRDIQLGRGETIADTARTLSGYLDGIMIRTFAQQEVEELANFSSVPVINGLTDKHHPCQALSDLFTIQENKGQLDRLKLAYVGDGNNVAHSLLLAAAKLGIDISIATPPDYAPQQQIIDQAQDLATTGELELLASPQKAVHGADIVYTDVWASMGQEEEAAKRDKVFASYQVDTELMDLADSEALFMHCLPAYRGKEVSSEVIDGPQSIVFEQAENRLHLQKAIMLRLMS